MTEIAASVIAGLIAGAVMTVWKMGEEAITGKGMWLPPNLIATIILGPRVATGRFIPSAFIVGMVLHAAASAAMGWLYGALVSPIAGALPPAAQLAVIVAFALVSWALYQYLMMPWLAPVMKEHSKPLSLAIAHVVWGLAFAAAILSFASAGG